MTASFSSNNIFIGIDVGGASLDVAWHRGGRAHCANRPDAIAELVRRLSCEPQVTRIAVEPTGGYEKPLVKALRQAGLPVEIVHTSRFAAYRTLIGQKAKSDTSDARLLAAYAASPDEVRGRRPDHVDLEENPVREALHECASRRDQLKQMIHAESCRLATTRLAEIRQAIEQHLDMLRAEDKLLQQRMQTLLRQSTDLIAAQRLLTTIKGIGVTSATTLIAMVPELGRVDNKAAAALVGVAPFVRQSGTMTAPARIRGGRAAVRHILYMAAVAANPATVLRTPDRRRQASEGCAHRRPPKARRVRQCRPEIRSALERRISDLTGDTVDSGFARLRERPE
jgi:transposase